MNLIQFFMGRIVPFRTKNNISQRPVADQIDQALRKEQMEIKKQLVASRDQQLARRTFYESAY